MSYYIIPYHIISYHIISYHIISLVYIVNLYFQLTSVDLFTLFVSQHNRKNFAAQKKAHKKKKKKNHQLLLIYSIRLLDTMPRYSISNPQTSQLQSANTSASSTRFPYLTFGFKGFQNLAFRSQKNYVEIISVIARNPRNIHLGQQSYLLPIRQQFSVHFWLFFFLLFAFIVLFINPQIVQLFQVIP